MNFARVLFIIFLVLKLTGLIAWSWWWIFAPLWLPVVAMGLVFMIAGIVGFKNARY